MIEPDYGYTAFGPIGGVFVLGVGMLVLGIPLMLACFAFGTKRFFRGEDAQRLDRGQGPGHLLIQLNGGTAMHPTVGYLATPTGDDGVALAATLARTFGATVDVVVVVAKNAGRAPWPGAVPAVPGRRGEEWATRPSMSWPPAWPPRPTCWWATTPSR